MSAEPSTNGTAPDDFKLKLAELKDIHGEVFVLRQSGVRVVCRLPKSEEYDRFRDELEKERGKKPIQAIERVFRQTCVWPPKDELAVILEKRQGLALTFGNAILEQAGIGEGCAVEKA